MGRRAAFELDRHLRSVRGQTLFADRIGSLAFHVHVAQNAESFPVRVGPGQSVG